MIKADGTFDVRTVPGTAAVYSYRCQVFGQIIPQGQTHLVACPYIPGLISASGLVDLFVDTPARVTGGADLVPGSPVAAAHAVHYVSGMTDRYALALGVELLGWRPEELPRGV